METRGLGLWKKKQQDHTKPRKRDGKKEAKDERARDKRDVYRYLSA
jgi:hypothetical protein